MGSDLCQVCWLVKNSEGQRERGMERYWTGEGKGWREGGEGLKRERERRAATMQNVTNFTHLPVLYRNYDPPIWYDTTIKLFQVHKVTASGSPQEQPS